MAVRRADVVAALAVHDREPLLAILEAARVPLRGAEEPHELASRIADALWWYHSTPLGYVVDNATLEDIVEHVAKKLKVQGTLEYADGWEMVRELTKTLSRTTGSAMHATPQRPGVSLDDLDEGVRGRLGPSWIPTAATATGASASYAAGAVGKVIVRLGKTPVGRLLPLIPKVGPVFRGIQVGAGAAALVGTPLSLALAVVSINEAMGTNYERLVPLLLGVGALGPNGVVDVEEVPA